MNILGISCHYHDSAACLIKDGALVAAIQEERLNRIKNSAEFPLRSINYCVQAGGIAFGDIDHIGFYEKPFLKFSRVVLGHLRSWPFSLNNFLDTIPQWLQDRLIIPLTLEKETGFQGKTLFIKHHLSHAASAFLVSPFEEAAILTADAVGEWTTMACGCGRGNRIDILREARYPDSLGLLYTAVTTFLGFAAHEGEGTVMALASYGKPRYLDKFKEVVRLRPDGSFFVDDSFFGFNHGTRMFSAKFVRSFGRPRTPGGKLEERHCDIACSLQRFTEEAVINVARGLHHETGQDNLCLAGGLFLNCVMNNKILEGTPFRQIFVQPAAGDSGGALGVAAYIQHSILNGPRDHVMSHAYLGSGFTDLEIKRLLLSRDIRFAELDDADLFRFVANEICLNKIVGWFQGRMEFGPRALGNRSILANPCDPNIKAMINAKVKEREPFRPYAPAVLEERAGEFFELSGDSPFMLLAARVRSGKKDVIPGVVHVDGTARVQTVHKETNGRFWRLIKEFEAVTGVPVLLNTSFNLRGSPIVCSPEDAVDCFNKSGMDHLVLGNLVVSREKAT